MTDDSLQLDLRAWKLIKRVLPVMPREILKSVVQRIEKDL